MASPSISSTTFYRLKVEDALSYLDQVKLQFAKQPDVYNQFLDIMKEFKSQSIDTPGVITRVSNLFRGHSDLIEGFNTFLPPGYKIEVHGIDSIHVTSPNSTLSTVYQTGKDPVVVQPIGTSTVTQLLQQAAMSSNNSNTQAQATLVNIDTGLNHAPLAQCTTSKLEQLGIQSSTTHSLGLIGSALGTSTNATTSKIIQTLSQHANNGLQTTSNPLGHQQQQQQSSNTTAATAAVPSQVEFGHAISYVNKIKSRFQNRPDIYKAFLDILHTYQKQQRNLKDGVIATGSEILSEAEVYAKVAKLFKNQADLLHEFSQFLPDANSSYHNTIVNASHTEATLQNLSSATTAAVNIENFANGVATAVAAAISSNNNNNKHAVIVDQPSTSQQQQQQKITSLSTITNTQQLQTNQKSQKYAAQQKPISKPTESTQKANMTSNMNHNRDQSPHIITNSGSVKRASSNHQLLTKKQRLGTSKTNTPNQKYISNIRDSNNNTNSNNNLANVHHQQQHQHQQQQQQQQQDTEIMFSHITEMTFFELVKKALRTPEVYKNFLRCIALFNQEIVTRTDLIKLVEPYLGKFPELYRWFKNYVEDKEQNNFATDNSSGYNNKHPYKDRIDLPTGDNVQLEIDYSSCKQYGASYREISAYPQALCSGRTQLCKQVLNDTFVSFPCWSEDSTFVTSKKNQYEELIFRTEDERFELDVILETNMATIRVLENVQKKMNKMTSDELSRFRLDNCFGGSSEVIHFKAIQRIYGDKAKDFIEGTKRNPAVAVPLVLKRLKAKEEEWREAKKNFEKVWREQCEKNFLKSLDYCAGPFKQSDQKILKTKSLLNEIETVYFERQEAKEDGQAHQQHPCTTDPPSAHNYHLAFKYDDKTILEDAGALIIHHVKRQMGIQKEDKQKIKQIVYHFLQDLFFVPRGALSDDEADDDDDDSSQSNLKTKKEKRPARHTDTNKRRLTDVDDKPKDVPAEYKNPEDMYRLFFINDHWYLFFRYHQILCERLHKIYKHSLNVAEQEHNDRRTREQSVAEALKLRSKTKLDVSPTEYYPTFLDIVRNLLDGNIDSFQYEDTLREMFGIHAYISFTLDKVVQNCVRQLQYLVQDDTCTLIRQYYNEEQRQSTITGKVAHMQLNAVQNAEVLYQKRVESLLHDQNCFKILIYKNSGRLTIELLDTENADMDENDVVEIEKWSEYIEKYCNDNQINEEFKDSLVRKPVFLTRCAHNLKQKSIEDDKFNSYLSIVQNNECKFDPNSYKIRYIANSNYFMYRKNSIKSARKSHHQVTRGMFDSFKKYLNKWLKDNSISSDTIDDWLIDGNSQTNECLKTTCTKDNSLKRTPYHAYYKYKTDKITNNVQATTSSSDTHAINGLSANTKIKDTKSSRNHSESSSNSNQSSK